MAVSIATHDKLKIASRLIILINMQNRCDLAYNNTLFIQKVYTLLTDKSNKKLQTLTFKRITIKSITMVL